MLEMKELQLAGKLTEKETREYAGPVHYVSNNEVFRPKK